MFIDYGLEICGNLEMSTRREWLVTNGIGGYASGTISGILTRRYHGLLIAALKPPEERTLMLAKLDETVYYGGSKFPLFTNHWKDGTIEPQGYHNLERFYLKGTSPVWTYACADVLIEKRIWMQPGANTTYIHYSVIRSNQPLQISIKALVNYRDHHSDTHADGSQPTEITSIANGIKVTAFEEATPLYILSSSANVSSQPEWIYGYFLKLEAYRGLEASEDHLYAGNFQKTLSQGDSLTLIASTNSSPTLDGESAYAERRDYERELIEIYQHEEAPQWINHLVLSADQFIVDRSSSSDKSGKTIIAGYHWFTDWGRDTMISLPGLTLKTDRPEIARSILLTYATYVDQGMLPNRFLDASEGGNLSEYEYNTVDATFWYFEAIRAYHNYILEQNSGQASDDELLRELFPVLQQIISWHCTGTRYGIQIDSNDGLLYAGEPGVQLTWMDVKVGNWVVTPRIGKPIEVNALWYNALCIMAEIATYLGEPSDDYTGSAAEARAGFARFWNNEQGYCYDVIDGPQGNDSALRPNQLISVSLPYSPLEPWQQKLIVDVCTRELLTHRGMRSLSTMDPHYSGHYGGGIQQRDAVYHQGTVWGWLIGPFVSAHLRVYRDPDSAASFLEPFVDHLSDYGLGSISEIFDGDPPFTPRGCIAQAWSVGEILRVWHELFYSSQEINQ